MRELNSTDRDEAHDRVVKAAVDAQRRFELPVRMGIATGETKVRDGDYFGTVLHRVMAAGPGGHILVAELATYAYEQIDQARAQLQQLR
ncbi:hypothetical protein A5790_07990 [Mycobacterium sp. 852002-51152_SCH6134967]|nr:hypothetical protein A5790_07990 [Mycobacterium sp. 852002-51152_SCH6134967]